MENKAYQMTPHMKNEQRLLELKELSSDLSRVKYNFVKVNDNYKTRLAEANFWLDKEIDRLTDIVVNAPRTKTSRT